MLRAPVLPKHSTTLRASPAPCDDSSLYLSLLSSPVSRHRLDQPVVEADVNEEFRSPCNAIRKQRHSWYPRLDRPPKTAFAFMKCKLESSYRSRADRNRKGRARGLCLDQPSRRPFSTSAQGRSAHSQARQVSPAAPAIEPRRTRPSTLAEPTSRAPRYSRRVRPCTADRSAAARFTQ